jgi:hypothetical protein
MVFDPAVVHMEQLSIEHAMDYSTTEDDNENVSVSIPVDNTYYIVVVPYEGARAPYQMEVKITSFEGCVDDEWDSNGDNNDTPQQAQGLYEGRYDDLMICPEDPDWYFMWLNSGERLVVDAYFTHASGDLDVIVYDPGVVDGGDPTEHEIDGGVSSDDNEHVEITAEVEGNHYIEVFGYHADWNDYSLEVSVP